VVVIVAGLIAPAGAGADTTVSGGLVFDGPGTRPASVKLVFTAFRSGFSERTVAITGARTQYSFNLPTGEYTNVDASIIGAVDPGAFWLPNAKALVRELPPPLPLLFPREFRSDDVLFRRGARLALPITDRAGKRFRPPHGWRSRGGTVSVDFGPEVALARNARVVTGLSDPAHASVTLALLYRDTFGKLRTIGPPTLTLNLPASPAGQTVSAPKLRIDSSPPSVRARALRGRRVALFLARDSQSEVSIIGSAAFVKSGRRYRALRNSAISVIKDSDPAAKLVPRSRLGILVKAGLRRTVRLCAANGHGVQPRLSRCARAVIGR